MEDKIFDIVTDLIREDITKDEAIDKLLVIAQDKPDGYTLLGACALDDKILSEAFTILFDSQWKRNWHDRDKANEMRSIIKGSDRPCRPFMNYAECIDFISRHCA